MRIFFKILCLLAFSGVINSAPTTDSEKLEKATDYRLPVTVWPSHYRIQLTPYLLPTDTNRFTFDGTVEITLSTTQNNIRNITLHARDINISETVFRWKENLTNLVIDEVTASDPDTNKFNVNLNAPLQPGADYVLRFKYTGIMGDDMHGFYRSKYTNARGEEVWIGSTQFQTNHARRAFPSFDEPKFKARFKIDITYPDNFSVVSNTLPERTIRIRTINRAITAFKETPVMSTYLVAFIISDFRGRGTSDNYMVYARPEAYDQTQYAYDVTPRLMNSLDAFTDYPYNSHGLEKMVLAGIPDFSAGAMENWGLLTYRETALLYDPQVSTLLNQQRVATVISHELAHQWFGDLVTCDWWGYTWLNEGFGRYFQYFTTHEVEPSWDLDMQFVVEQIQSVMNMDSLPGTTPMSDPTVGSPAELSRMFNSISYNKGASILRMIEHLITPTKFKDGLRNFLKARAFQTSLPEHLFDAFSQQYGQNLAALMRDWTEQVGYPVVTVTLAKDGNSFTVKQKRFLLREDPANAGILYQIPFTYTTDADMNFANTLPSIILPKNTAETNITLSKPAKFIIANIQETGYYRVNYDENIWKNIRVALGSKDYGGIHILNRGQLVDDGFNLARAGLITYPMLMDLTSYLKEETHYIPWYAAFQGYSYLTIRLGVENQKYFKTYILDLLSNVYKTVGFNMTPNERRLITYNRGNVLNWACRYDHEDCVKNSKTLFNQFMSNNSPVPVNSRSVVYCTSIRTGGSNEFDFLWKKYKDENVATEQVVILNALGCCSNKDQLFKYLDLILSDDVRLQDRQAAFTATYTSNIENVDMVWEYVERNYTHMITSFGSQSTVASLINGLAGRFTTKVQRDALDKFITEKDTQFGSSVSTLKSALTSVDFNMKWASESMKPFVEHLRGGATTMTISTVLLLMASYVAFLVN